MKYDRQRFKEDDGSINWYAVTYWPWKEKDLHDDEIESSLGYKPKKKLAMSGRVTVGPLQTNGGAG